MWSAFIIHYPEYNHQIRHTWHVQSSVILSIFREFISELEGKAVKITNTNLTGLQRLCKEFISMNLQRSFHNFCSEGTRSDIGSEENHLVVIGVKIDRNIIRKCHHVIRSQQKKESRSMSLFWFPCYIACHVFCLHVISHLTFLFSMSSPMSQCWSRCHFLCHLSGLHVISYVIVLVSVRDDMSASWSPCHLPCQLSDLHVISHVVCRSSGHMICHLSSLRVIFHVMFLVSISYRVSYVMCLVFRSSDMSPFESPCHLPWHVFGFHVISHVMLLFSMSYEKEENSRDFFWEVVDVTITHFCGKIAHLHLNDRSARRSSQTKHPNLNNRWN
jgi:hypothetical protein